MSINAGGAVFEQPHRAEPISESRRKLEGAAPGRPERGVETGGYEEPPAAGALWTNAQPECGKCALRSAV